jgi:hypothetical protein
MSSAEIAWRHDFDRAVAEAGERLVLVDFTAAPL